MLSFFTLLPSVPVGPDSDDGGKLLCTCENQKKTCVNGTCVGDVCFYSWVRGDEERGCFSNRIYKEHCYTSFDRFFIHCCRQDKCNAFTTPPPRVGQYILQLFRTIVVVVKSPDRPASQFRLTSGLGSLLSGGNCLPLVVG